MKLNRRTLLAGVSAATITGMVVPRRLMAATPIRIGALMPLSGGAALVGAKQRIGVEIARDQINAAGGVNGQPIEIIFMDDKGDPNQTIANARELSADGVTMLIGPALSSQNKALIQIIQSLNMVQMTASSPLDSLTHELYNPNFFRMTDSNHLRTQALARAMAENYPDVTEWTGIISDISIGHQSWDGFEAALKKHYKEINNKDVKITEVITAKYGTPDFKPQIFRALKSGVQGVYNLTFGADMVTLWKQAKTLGLTDQLVVVADGGGELDLPVILGKDMPKALWSNVHWNPLDPNANAISKELTAEAIKRTGEDYPSSLMGSAHAAVLAYAAAVEAAGSTDTDAIITALESVEVETAMGKIQFRKEDHQKVGIVNILESAPTADGFEFKAGTSSPATEIIEPAAPGVEHKY